MPTSIKICTRRSFRNRRGVCFLKSWAAQRPRGPISEIEEVFAFSKAGLLKDHEGRSQKWKRRLLSQKLGCSETTRAEIEEAPAFSALSALITCTLSFAEITGNLSKISGEVEST
ncbi:hypothetical protein EV2_030873 [Malus domestica]